MDVRTNLYPAEPVRDPVATLRREIAGTPRIDLHMPDFSWAVFYRVREVCGRPFKVCEWTGVVNQLIAYRGLCVERPRSWEVLAGETPTECTVWQEEPRAERRAQALIATLDGQVPKEPLTRGEVELPQLLLRRLGREAPCAFIERVIDFWTLFKPDVSDLEGLPREVRRQFKKAVTEIAETLHQHQAPVDERSRAILKEALLALPLKGDVPARVDFHLQVLAFCGANPGEAIASLQYGEIVQCEALFERDETRRCIAERLLPNGCPIREPLLGSKLCNALLKGRLQGLSWAALFERLLEEAGVEDAPLLQRFAEWKQVELVTAPTASPLAARLRKNGWGGAIADQIDPPTVSLNLLEKSGLHALKLVHRADPAKLSSLRMFLWEQFRRSKNRKLQEEFVKFALSHANQSWSVPPRITPNLAQLIPIESAEIALAKWRAKDALLRRLCAEPSKLGPLGAAAVFENYRRRRQWPQLINVLEAHPKLLTHMTWRPFPHISADLVSRLAALAHLPCESGGLHELIGAQKLWAELHRRVSVETSKAVMLRLFDPMARLISEDDPLKPCGDLTILCQAAAHIWGDAAPVEVTNNLVLVDAVLTAREADPTNHDKAVDVLYHVADEDPQFPRLAWAIVEMLRTVKVRPGDNALAQRALLRLAARHANWGADQLAQFALDVAEQGATPQQMLTLLAPQSFRVRMNQYDIRTMAEVYFRFGEGAIERRLCPDYLVLALGQIRYVDGMRIPDFDRGRLDRMLQGVGWAERAYQQANEIFGATFPRDGTPMVESRIIVELAFRLSNDLYDEHFTGLDYRNVGSLAETARSRWERAHHFRGTLPETFTWLGVDNDRLWRGILARAGDSETIEHLRGELDRELQQECRSLEKLAWRSLTHRLVSCLSHYAGLPASDQRTLLLPLLEQAMSSGLFDNARPIIKQILQQMLDKQVDILGPREGPHLGMEMVRLAQQRLGSGFLVVPVEATQHLPKK